MDEASAPNHQLTPDHHSDLAAPLTNAQQQAILVFRDIMARKRAGEALRLAQQRTESILSSAADIHMVLDQQWRYLYVNAAAVKAIGQARERLLGRTIWEVYPDIVGTELGRQYRRASVKRSPSDSITS